MSITEKLGIEQIEAMSIPYGEYGCEVFEVRKLETQRDDMLEALIGLYQMVSDQGYVFGGNNPATKAIKKATGKSWEEIKIIISMKTRSY